ncbi:hypothetical protein MPER_04745 [Moniliophthora perniciosa FA553]|nr:hypothetical protein MPER_04745 [Moniliophthora perniciosa FA553]
MAIFIESALLYTAWTIIFIITFAAESHVEAMMTDCWAVIAGISFGLINVRIGMGWAKPCSIASTSTFTFHRFRIGDSHQATMDETPHQMQTLAVHVNMTQSSPEAVSFPDNHPDRGSAHSGQDQDRLKEDELEV